MLSTLIVSVPIMHTSPHESHDDVYQHLANIMTHAPASISHLELEFDTGVNRTRGEEYMVHSEWEHLDDLLGSRADLQGVTIRFIDYIVGRDTKAAVSFRPVIKMVKKQIPKLISRKDLVSFGECNKASFFVLFE